MVWFHFFSWKESLLNRIEGLIASVDGAGDFSDTPEFLRFKLSKTKEEEAIRGKEKNRRFDRFIDYRDEM